MKIYIIEDDKVLRTELMKLLNSYGYECAYSDDWQNIIQLALQESPDLILLDINLPLFDGFHICREIRKQSEVPIMVVTSRSTDMDELMSMNLGADDFITKPYNTQILVARIAALLKRSAHVPVSEEIEYKGVIFRPSKGLISYGADSTELTKNEMKILSVLLKNAGKIVSRDELMDELWQSDEFVDDNTLTVNVNRLRKKLENIGAKEFIATKRGIGKYGVKPVAAEGRPSYDPKSLYKIYIYGSRKGIRSSRKLAESCKVNLEVKWMIGGVEPDFRTIADFRKNNIDSLKEIFYEFNRRISGAVEWGFSSVDGTKIQADNAKDNNFTKNKLDDRIKWLNGHTDEYLRILNEMDKQEEADEISGELTRENLEAKLKEAQERLARYDGYQKLMEETGASQLSITDADAKLMKNKNGFAVAYNPQTAVDSETHLIRDFQMTNQVTDHGLLESTMQGIKSSEPEKIIEVVADKGYEAAEDMVECLENGIIPHVITDDGKDGYDIEIPYEEAETDTASTEPEELKKALHAGKIPEVYAEVIQDMRVETVRRKVVDEKRENSSVYGSPEEMQEKAKEGYFVRDPERNLVYCPAGEILRQKSIKKNGNIRYVNKNACKHCPNRNKCYKGKGEWKEIDFTKDQLVKPCKGWLEAEGKKPEETKTDEKWHYEKRKVVKFFLKPDKEKMSRRMCLSEHPFGTIKRAMGATYFLLRGIQKVAGEFALFCLGYNLERAKNLLGFQKMMELMEQA